MEAFQPDSPSLQSEAIAALRKLLKSLTEEQLISVLNSAESRLGTSEERPEDFEMARSAMHQINNLRTAGHLRRRPEA